MFRFPTLIAAGAVIAAVSATSVEAMPVKVEPGAASPTVLVAGGCGPYRHRGPYGGCRPGGGWGPGWRGGWRRGWGPGYRRHWGPGYRRGWGPGYGHRRYVY